MESDSSEPPSFELNAFSDLVQQDWSTTQNWIYISIIIILMICSALVSGSEIAFFSFQTDDLDEFKQSKSKRENTIYKLITQPRRLLSTILISNNFFNIGIVVVSFYLLANLFNFDNKPSWLRMVIETGLVTFLIVLFGEVIPKVYATQRGRTLARFMARPLEQLSKILKPFSSILIKTTDGLEQKITKNSDQKNITAEEVDMAIDLTTNENSTDEEVQILKSIVRFGEIAVHDVMTSRPDVYALSDSSGFDDIIQTIRTSGFSRIPVFKEELDQIIGILYAKDLLAYLDQGDDFQWKKLTREPFFVPENKKIDDLLKDFQENHTHMAIVVDEYGGTAGLITLEDVLEEIIGDIKDEFDDLQNDVKYEKIADNRFLFEGKTSLFDSCKILNVDYQQFEQIKGESDSIAGLILEISGKFPRKNQVIPVQDLIFKVVDLDQKRIKTVEIELLS